MKQFQLNDRFENFAVSIVTMFDGAPNTYAGDYLAKQLMRSACSAALNFGEFEGAGSDRDRTNKLRLTLKELRESLNNINIQRKAKLKESKELLKLGGECEELIKITITILKKYD